MAATYDGAMTSTAAASSVRRSHPWAVAALVAVNLVPLVGVLLLGWRLTDLMLLYWLESGIIGGFTVLKIVTSRVPALETAPGHGDALVPLVHRLGAAGTALFFSVHYGLFWAVHGVFVRLLFGPGPGPFGAFSTGPGMGLPPGLSGGLPMTGEPFGPVASAIGGGFALAVLSLVVSHGTSFVVNYLGQGEDRSLSPLALMQQPYGRVIVLHVTIIGGGFFAMFLGQPLLSLVLLIALKIGVDLHAHLREHDR
ncbi:MAG: hypothetical protein EA416_11715 [Trueperaceae bacterium]|nr:MAG: hypothetical protein EA416_11715 [Trueperaceae bacterium]